MKSKRFKAALVLTALLIWPCTPAWAQEKKDGIFSVTPAFAFAWYPAANFFEEKSTNTEVDIDNFGMSFIMSLKLFNKVGAHLNLKIDDPTFQKLVDFAGYVTAYHFMIKFDYHSFGGTVTWAGNTPNPISGGAYNFRNQWSTVSLLFRVDQLEVSHTSSIGYWLGLFLLEPLREMGLRGMRNLGAIGIGYAKFDMPLEYRGQHRGLSNSGFGSVKGEDWGLSMLWDTLTWTMERPASYTRDMADFVWIYLDWFHGFPPFGSIGKGETDVQAIAWMSNANGGASVNGDINRSIQYTIVKVNLGLQYVWNVEKKGQIGLAVGMELLEETIDASNDDIYIRFWSRHIGPAVRVSVRW